MPAINSKKKYEKFGVLGHLIQNTPTWYEMYKDLKRTWRIIVLLI